jgi:hypothetical protein
MIIQGYQDLRDVARKREFTGKMIAGIKNDIKRILQSTFSEVEKLVNVFSLSSGAFILRLNYIPLVFLENILLISWSSHQII